jgi:hypothetical protein
MSIEWKGRSPAPCDHVSQDMQIVLRITSILTSYAQSVPKNIARSRKIHQNIEKYRNP